MNLLLYEIYIKIYYNLFYIYIELGFVTPKVCTRSLSTMGSTDGSFEKDRIVKSAGDPTRREFTYFMLGGARFIYASAARLALIKVI
jgi:ubiquinol-cytochrome c reductase iron-sulfur subunit